MRAYLTPLTPLVCIIFKAVVAMVSPMVSKNDNDKFYFVAGSTLYARRTPKLGGQVQRSHNTGDVKTKSVLDSGEFVYSVESTDGRIYK